jgi:2-polyprenyl-3-methyl-5-hydroxy-6-metoxy-1,4-benzoquinol methylase
MGRGTGDGAQPEDEHAIRGDDEAQRGAYSNYGAIYDHIYATSPAYGEEMDILTDRASKDPIIARVIEVFAPRTVVDLGCGQGHYLRKLKQDFDIDVTGVEVSRVCCETYLAGLKHVNEDIYTFLKTPARFDLLLCTDVLEHIAEDEIDAILFEAARMAPVALYGIANHSDVQAGIELHLTAKPVEWWLERLSRNYVEVRAIAELYEGRFFFILGCSADKNALASEVIRRTPPGAS